MFPVKHTFRGQSRQDHDQCTCGTMRDVCRLTIAESKTVKYQRHPVYSAVTHTVCANWSTPMDRSQMSRKTLLEPQTKTAYYTGLLCIPKVQI